MTELDHVWSEMIGNATAAAIREKNHVVLDYLMLRATNDQIRAAGVSWLFDTASEMAAAAMHSYPHLMVESIEPSSFRHGNSNLVGKTMNFRHGVRCLSLEAGWTRTPIDGIMRGGALATARFSHFGIQRATEIFSLTLSEPSPVWRNGNTMALVSSDVIERHFRLLLDV